MAKERLPMRKIKEALRLKYICLLSNRKIGRSCDVVHSTVADYLRRAHVAGLTTWEQVAPLTETTLELLWQEYKELHPDGYQYSQFCDLYHRRLKKQDVCLRQDHKWGEKVFVDYCDGLFLVNPVMIAKNLIFIGPP